MQLVFPLTRQSTRHNNQHSEVLILACQYAENRTCFYSLAQANLVCQHIADGSCFKASSNCADLMWEQKGSATCQDSETIGGIIHKMKVPAHLEMVDKPCRMLKLIGSELLVWCIVHLRIVKLQLSFALLNMFAIGKLNPIPIRHILCVRFRGTRYNCASPPSTLNDTAGTGFTTSYRLRKEHIVLKDIFVVLATTQEVVHFDLNSIGNFVVLVQLSKDIETGIIFVTFFNDYGTSIITPY